MKTQSGISSDRPTNQPPFTNPLANKEKRRKNHSKLPMSNNKSWTFSIFVCATSPHHTIPLGFCILGIPNEGKILPFTLHNLFEFRAFQEEIGRKAEEMDQEDSIPSQFTYGRKVFKVLLVVAWWLLLLLFYIIFARMYGPFDHLGIRHRRAGWFFAFNSSKRTHKQNHFMYARIV